MPHAPTPLLDQVRTPDDLKDLSIDQLRELAGELRRFLIGTVSRTGGHLAAGLGTVELTIALHHVFDTPDDRLIWDVGHQAYPHKILTGRKQRMSTLRQKGGLSGFLRRDESEYDAFGAGHSSTSISAAQGMAVAAEQLGESRQVVAIIGDGAMSAGMAYEALNNAGGMQTDLLVILNDNDMSISPNVGALSNYLARVLSGRAFTTVREGSKKVLGTAPPVAELAKRWEEHMKGMLMPSTLFEEMGFYYIGPVDGHDIKTLVKTLRNLKGKKGPRFLHVITKKGKGFDPAEVDPCVYHGVSPFDPKTGKMGGKSSGITYTDVFSDWIMDMAAKDEKLVAITPAMCEGSGLSAFREAYPERYFDVGIAEQHALTFAAGLACEGVKPVVAIYSTFLQRAYDQLVHDICLQNLPVMLAVDRAGLVGADGATHTGNLDIAFMRSLPNMVVMAPADENECRKMLSTAHSIDGPTAVRYPRGGGPGVAVEKTLETLEVGKAEIRKRGKGVAILAFGTMVAPAEKVAEKLDATLVNMRFVKPLDEQMVEKMAKSHTLLVTIEENVIQGGAGSAVAETLSARGLNTRLLQLGLPDQFIEHGTQAELLADCGLDAAGIERSIRLVIGPELAHAADFA
ncbi:MAG: 1-deoxy-D-xylulose-5-phosphate synthase [Gammaproteobacteria bacterium]|nr:MAG: 1-deoxy-D-xylulose-5-phosphate synthase [Gammaproteobacteria bacterium]